MSANCFLVYISSSPTVDCPPLMDPPGGRVNIPSLTQGSTATYSCNEGYMLVGDSTRTCEASAMWTGIAPVCQSKYMTYHFTAVDTHEF